MQEIQDTLTAFDYRVDIIKKRLRTSSLSDDERYINQIKPV